MTPLLYTDGRTRSVDPPAGGAPGPLEVALSLLVHRAFPLRPAGIDVAADWLGLNGPAVAGSAVHVAALRGITRQRVQTVRQSTDGLSTPGPLGG